jgi:hypothetical protein
MGMGQVLALGQAQDLLMCHGLVKGLIGRRYGTLIGTCPATLAAAKAKAAAAEEDGEVSAPTM